MRRARWMRANSCRNLPWLGATLMVGRPADELSRRASVRAASCGTSWATRYWSTTDQSGSGWEGGAEGAAGGWLRDARPFSPARDLAGDAGFAAVRPGVVRARDGRGADAAMALPRGERNALRGGGNAPPGSVLIHRPFEAEI